MGSAWFESSGDVRAAERPGRGLRLLVAVTDPMSLLFLRGQLSAARAAGFDVTVLSGPGDLARRVALAEGVRHVPVAMARGMDPVHDAAALVELVRLLRSMRPHIVDASTPKAGLLLMLAAAITRVPCRIHTLRGLRFETMTGPGRRVLMATTRLTCALAHRVLCVSPSLRSRAIELGLVPAHKAVVLGMGSGLDLARFTATPAIRDRAAALRRELGIAADAPVLGFVGRIARDKGFVELSAAWQALRERYPGLHWVIAGPLDPTDAIPVHIGAELDTHPRVHRLGHVDDVTPVYAMMDVLALPTYREGFGNVLIEAAALGIPAVASRVTGCVDAVDDGVTGTLVPARNVDALVAAIAAYVDNPELRQAHGRAGRARAERLFRQEDLWARTQRTYLELAAQAGCAGARTATEARAQDQAAPADGNDSAGLDAAAREP